uniref:Mitochondrial fission process protein 1 n=1 Tax=Ciona savignyi TaxID=51511 RepID=H2YXE2_CIOSA
MISEMSNSNKGEEKTDIFRHTPLRYMGYANEVGEAFRSMVPRSVVYASYVVASTYVLADASSKGFNFSKNTTVVKSNSPVLAFTDALIWQSLASVIIPGFVINRVCAGTLYMLQNVSPKMPLTARKWTSTIIGLLAIPAIIQPIDRTVDFAMDTSIRRLYWNENTSTK